MEAGCRPGPGSRDSSGADVHTEESGNLNLDVQPLTEVRVLRAGEGRTGWDVIIWGLGGSVGCLTLHPRSATSAGKHFFLQNMEKVREGPREWVHPGEV